MALNRSFTLNTGARVPAVGFGTWQAKSNEVRVAVEAALRAGYRHIDCASIYRNEVEVGQGIRASGVPREEIFITSKLWNSRHRPEQQMIALDRCLECLGVDYLDLYLMHWPCAFRPGAEWFPVDSEGVFVLDKDCDYVQTWKGMEKLLASGKVRAIGIANFNERRINHLLSSDISVIPAVNQIEVHPYLQQPSLHKLCKEKGILIQAYSPLGNNQTGAPKTVDDPKVHELAGKLDKDPAQLLISWGVQKGHVVLSKSVTESRIRSNFRDFVVPDDVMGELDGLERHKRFNFPSHWGYDIFDEAGEEFVRKSALNWAEKNKKRA